MLKLLMTLSLFFYFSCPAFAEEDQTKKIIAEAGYQSFRKLQKDNKNCVRSAVISQMTVLSIASLSGGLLVEQLKHKPQLPKRYFQLARAGTLGIMVATVMEAVYYLTSDENLFTYYNFNAVKHVVTQSHADQNRGQGTLSAFYATRDGFLEFLNVDSEEIIRKMMEENITLAVGSITLLRYVEISDCRILESLSPNRAETLTPP